MWRHGVAAVPRHKEEVTCVIPVTLGIVLLGAVLLAGAAIGARAAGVIHGHGRLTHGRRSCSLGLISGFSLVTSRIALTAEGGSPAFQDPAGAAGERPDRKAPAQLHIPR